MYSAKIGFLCDCSNYKRAIRFQPGFAKNLILVDSLNAVIISSEAQSDVGNRHLNIDLLSSKVNIEPSLEELVGHQGHTKLWGRPAHSSWRGRGKRVQENE